MAGAPAGGVTANPMQQASMAQQGALAGTATGMAYSPAQTSVGGTAPQVSVGGTMPQVQAGQLSATDLSQYQNPFTQQVIDTTMADLERQRQMQMNQLGAQASSAGAYGGSRQGVAESLTNEAFARQGAQTAAGLRQAGFQTAQQMAQQDIASRMQAGLANQAAAGQDIGFGLQAGLANQAAAQQDIANRMRAQEFNVQSGLQGAQQRLGAAQQLAGLGQQSFGYGTAIQSQLAQQGQQQQAMQQALLDAAKAQYAGYTGAPAAGLGYASQALGAAPVPTTTTESRQPGLFDYLTLAASARPR